MFRFFVLTVASLVMCHEANSQTYLLDSPKEGASGFNTSLGFITAGHVQMYKGLFHDTNHDFKIGSPIKGGRLRFGTGKPSYFVDRRGFTVSLDCVRTSNDRFVVKQRFFQGESGLPVFNKDGEVVGLVVGYYATTKEGLVSRFETLRIPAVVINTIRSIRPPGRFASRPMTLIELQRFMEGTTRNQ